MGLHEVLSGALAALDCDKPVFGGFSAARDIVLSLSGDGFLEWQEAAKCPVPAVDGAIKGVLESVEDIAACFAACVAAGAGRDVPLAAPEIGEPLAAHFPAVVRVGGTGVQVANCLAHCGFGNCVAHVPFLAPEMREILHPAIRLIGNNSQYAALMAKRRTFPGVHYILDYAAGTAVRTKQGVLRASRPDRIILGGNPFNAALRIAPAFSEAAAGEGKAAPSLVMAGFSAPRGLEAFHAFVDDCAALLRRRHGGASSGFVHVEECHHANQPRERRAAIRDRIWPGADSLGMNEAEFADLALFLGLDANDMWGSLHAIAVRHNLKRVCLHSAALCRAVTRRDAASERLALGMGVLLASARAYYGGFVDLAAIRAMLEALGPLPASLPVPEPLNLGDGYIGVELPSLRGLPVRSSIGLGDAFTAGTLAFS